MSEPYILHPVLVYDLKQDCCFAFLETRPTDEAWDAHQAVHDAEMDDE